MSGQTDFRTQEEEVIKLVEEYSELRRTLKTISAQLGRMESRVKRAFPAIVEQNRTTKSAKSVDRAAAISAEEAIAQFNRIVALVEAGKASEAERLVESKSAGELLTISREFGISFSKPKPSVSALREAIFGKVRESVMLTKHTYRNASNA